VHGLRTGLAAEFGQPAFLFEWGAALVSGTTAAYTAFCISLPDRSPYWSLLPIASVAIWLLGFGYGIGSDWIRMGWAAFELRPSWSCVRFLIMMTIPLIGALLFLIRSGASVRPLPTVLLATLSTTAIASSDLDLIHDLDRTFLILIWHGGTLAVLLGVAYIVGPRFLGYLSPSPRHS